MEKLYPNSPLFLYFQGKIHYLRVCTHTHTHTHTHTCTLRTHMYPTHTHPYTHMYTHVPYTHTPIHTRTHTRSAYTCMHTHTHAHTHTHTPADLFLVANYNLSSFRFRIFQIILSSVYYFSYPSFLKWCRRFIVLVLLHVCVLCVSLLRGFAS